MKHACLITHLANEGGEPSGGLRLKDLLMIRLLLLLCPAAIKRHPASLINEASEVEGTFLFPFSSPARQPGRNDHEDENRAVTLERNTGVTTK